MKLILLALYLQSGICGAEWSKEQRLRENQQLDLWQKKLSEINNLSGETKIEELSLGLVSMAFRKQFGGRDPKTDVLYLEIQAALLAIPGHAEYYRNRILQAEERYKSVPVDAPGTTWQEYRNEISNVFQIFPHLHSPEGVRVLGELFSNDWVPSDNETAVLSEKFVPLSVCARVALQKFPIQGKPFKEPITKLNAEDAQAAWELWYEQIKAGNLTFRFEGDPTEYDLNGPAPKEKLVRIERDRKRDEERATGLHKSPAGQETGTARPPIAKPSAIAGLMAALAVCLAAVWYFLRGRRVARQ